VATPLALIVATLIGDAFQVTLELICCELPSWKVPVAVNVSVVLAVIVGAEGVTAMEARPSDTVRRLEPTMEPEVALMVTFWARAPRATPPWLAATAVAKPELLMVTTLTDELHVALEVRSFVLPSL
jgi:hypothetical protein